MRLWRLNEPDLIHILQKGVFFLWRSNRGCFPLTVPLPCGLLGALTLRLQLALVYIFCINVSHICHQHFFLVLMCSYFCTSGWRACGHCVKSSRLHFLFFFLHQRKCYTSLDGYIRMWQQKCVLVAKYISCELPSRLCILKLNVNDVGFHNCKMDSSDMCLLPRAVVTGATSGIGKAYATEVGLQFPFFKNKSIIWSKFHVRMGRVHYNLFRRVLQNSTIPVCLHVFFQLARRGLDVVLVSRCHDKLQTVAKEIGESNVKNTGVLQQCSHHNRSICHFLCCSGADLIQSALCLLQRISTDERLAPSKSTSQTATVSTLRLPKDCKN